MAKRAKVSSMATVEPHEFMQSNSSARTSNVLRIIPNQVNRDTIAALEYLLQEAKRGELIGLVYGGMLKGRSCIVDTTGEACRNPMFALGMVGMLSADISDRTREASE